MMDEGQDHPVGYFSGFSSLKDPADDAAIAKSIREEEATTHAALHLFNVLMISGVVSTLTPGDRITYDGLIGALSRSAQAHIEELARIDAFKALANDEMPEKRADIIVKYLRDKGFIARLSQSDTIYLLTGKVARLTQMQQWLTEHHNLKEPQESDAHTQSSLSFTEDDDEPA